MWYTVLIYALYDNALWLAHDSSARKKSYELWADKNSHIWEAEWII